MHTPAQKLRRKNGSSEHRCNKARRVKLSVASLIYAAIGCDNQRIRQSHTNSKPIIQSVLSAAEVCAHEQYGRV